MASNISLAAQVANLNALAACGPLLQSTYQIILAAYNNANNNASVGAAQNMPYGTFDNAGNFTVTGSPTFPNTAEANKIDVGTGTGQVPNLSGQFAPNDYGNLLALVQAFVNLMQGLAVATQSDAPQVISTFAH